MKRLTLQEMKSTARHTLLSLLPALSGFACSDDKATAVPPATTPAAAIRIADYDGGGQHLEGEQAINDLRICHFENGLLTAIHEHDIASDDGSYAIPLEQQGGTLYVVANTDEQGYANFDSDPNAIRLKEFAAQHNMEVIPVCAKIEDELNALEPDEAAMFMEELGMKSRGLDQVIKTGYKLLNYITFFTAGPMESRAWTITAGTPAPQAAGKIHTDMCRGFIRMEVVSYDDMVQYGSWNKAQTAGKLRIEGKEYIVQDGDVIHVRFSV